MASLWRYRRWAYGAYVLYGVLRIPSRTGFQLDVPVCDLRFTFENVVASLTKVPHVLLFGFLFLITVVQFDRVDRRSLAWSFLATVAMGALIEIEEGATRTGNCRMTDVAPDACGALVAMTVAIAVATIQRRRGSRSRSATSG